MASARGARVDVALLGAAVPRLGPRRALDIDPGPGASAAKIGSMASKASRSPPTIRQKPRSSPQTPPGGAGVQVGDAARPQLVSPTHVVEIEAVAAVDENVAGGKSLADARHRLLGDRAGRQHEPHPPGRRQALRSDRRDRWPRRAILDQRLAWRADPIEHDAGVTGAHQPPCDRPPIRPRPTTPSSISSLHARPSCA